MEVEAVETSPEDVDADILGVTFTEPAELPSAAAELDRRLRGRLTHLIEDGELTGSRGAVTLLHSLEDIAPKRLAATGTGKPAQLDADAFRTAAAAVARRTRRSDVRTVAWLLDDDRFTLGPGEQARALAEGLVLGRYEAGRWKTNGDGAEPVERLVLCGPGAQEAVDGARRASHVAGWVNRCRDAVNAPPNELTPARLAEVAREVAAGSAAVTFEELGPDDIAAAGMDTFSAVAQGSHNPPRLIVLRYEPEDATDELLLGLVGKAITFDTGGISLKPPDNMEEMKSDMSGGAAVINAVGAVAELRLPVRLLAVVPAAENMPGGHAYRPGDIVKAASGKTVEVNNTDAEGRLVLADALWYARGQGATHLVDLATLTGTIQVAMGDFYAGLFGNDPDWIDAIRAAAESSGDHAWPMPLHPTYRRFLESQFADLKNTPEKNRGSSIIAALFLEEFAGEGPWGHLDIAGTAFLDRGRDYYPRPGATGYGVRLLADLATSLAGERG